MGGVCGRVSVLGDVTANGFVNATGKTIDLNGCTLTADLLGTIKVNGGTFATSKYTMVAKENAYYLSEDAVFTIAGADLDTTVHSGKLTLGNPEGWTNAGQELVIEAGATFEIPANYKLYVQSVVTVAGKVTVAGEVILYNAEASITVADQELNVTMRDGIGDKVWYTDGKYVVHTHTKRTIPAVDPTLTETGLTEGVECSVCGDILVKQQVVEVLAQATVNGVAYETLAEALNAAYAAGGGTVQLVKDLDLGNQMVMIMDQVTLDLNGKTLKTTGYVLAIFDESYIVDSSADNSGRLDVSLDKLRLLDGNAAMPVQMSDGIMLAAVSVGHAWGNKAGNYQFWLNSADQALVSALKTTAASKLGLKFQVEVRWGDSFLCYTFSDETVMRYMNDSRGWDVGAALGLILRGAESTEGLTYRAKVVFGADTDAQVVSWTSGTVDHNYAQ